jgi:hypothetical protein
MFHNPKKGDSPGQSKQFIRVCMSCEYVYFSFGKSKHECPKCTWPSYGAPFVYGGWINAFCQLITQSRYKRKKGD